MSDSEEMIEKVARALCDYDESLQPRQFSDGSRWDTRTDLGRAAYREAASIAIQTMREPTDWMLENAERMCLGMMTDRGEGLVPYYLDSWRIMADAALGTETVYAEPAE
jgi:hypothetical protein